MKPRLAATALVAASACALALGACTPGANEPDNKQAKDAGIVVVTHEGASQQNTIGHGHERVPEGPR